MPEVTFKIVPDGADDIGDPPFCNVCKREVDEWSVEIVMDTAVKGVREKIITIGCHGETFSASSTRGIL